MTVHLDGCLELVLLPICSFGISVIGEALLAPCIQQGQVTGMKDKQNKTWLNTASGCSILPFHGQRIDKLAFKRCTIFRVELHGGFESAFLIQAVQFLGADPKSDVVIFDTYIHRRESTFNGVTVTCAL